MAVQDSISQASISLARAQETLNYIFDNVTGPTPTTTESQKISENSLTSQAQYLCERMEQLESQLSALSVALIAPQAIPASYGIHQDIFNNQRMGNILGVGANGYV